MAQMSMLLATLVLAVTLCVPAAIGETTVSGAQAQQVLAVGTEGVEALAVAVAVVGVGDERSSTKL
jgi:hypothetical protein